MYAFGASGVAALPDGRLVIAEDEWRHPLVIVDLFGTGAAREFSEAEVKEALRRTGASALNDLEGITIDGAGHLYATTSHAVPRDGVQTPDRQLVVRFDVTGDALTNVHATAGLAAALTRLDDAIAKSIGKKVKTPFESPGLSIEGIAWDPHGNRLLLGLRGPLRDGQAQVVSLDNVDDVFERGAMPVLSGPYLLDLGAQGIRDLTYDPEMNAFLLVAGASGRSEYGHAELWQWSGPDGPPAVRLVAPILDTLKPEGVAAITVRGQRLLLFVCDDGWLDTDFYRGRAPINKGIPSSFAVLPASVLRQDNPLTVRLNVPR